MVGGDPFITKSILHVTRSPWSRSPSVTDDVGEVFGRYVIDGAFHAAGDDETAHAIRSQGLESKDAFWADITPYESGSDHWIYQEGGFRIPAVYLRDHPDVYIHTTGDLPDNIEPTKIKRSAFIAAASGYYLATMPDARRIAAAIDLCERARTAGGRTACARRRWRPPVIPAEAASIIAHAVGREQRRLQTLPSFCLPRSSGPRIETLGALADRLRATGASMTESIVGASASIARDVPPVYARIPVRNPAVKGPLAPDGDWLADKAGRGAAAIAITRVPRSDDVTYEIVNFIDGARSIADIRNAVSAEFEPIELSAVAEYIDLLARAGAVSFKP